MKKYVVITLLALSAGLAGCGDKKIAVTAKEEQMIKRICGKAFDHPESQAYVEQGLAAKVNNAEECEVKLKDVIMSAKGSDTVQLEKRKSLLNSVTQELMNISIDKANSRYYTSDEEKTYETKPFSEYLK